MQGFETCLLLVASPLLGWAIWALRQMSPPWRFELSAFLFGCVAVTSLIVGQKAPPPVALNLPLQQGDAGAQIDLQATTNPAALTQEQPSSAPGFDRWTAVYDISSHTVYLPNGVKLEAHSGLGPRLDDPRYVHERMRGATPPNVYELTLREKPFHGVRALRLKPMDRDKVFGRTGLLAHTYMLGPKGDSNGCVVFKDYDIFLQAFEAGELKRLAVVARLESSNLGPVADGRPRPQRVEDAGVNVTASVLSP